ncbi:MAG: hypothetical protein KDB88_01580 [Flavobacteriales bacterium]|nr:hypothetical protein [Flavobacteriales bacterium]
MSRLLTLMAIMVMAELPAQPGLFPLSRQMEAPYTALMHRWKNTGHTAIRPYLRADVAPLGDSLLPRATLPFLDRWAGNDSSRFRGGPLLDLLGGVTSGRTTDAAYRAGAGFWTSYALHPQVELYADGRIWNERFADHLDTLVQATGVAPGEGYAYGDGPNYTHYDWNAHVSWTTAKHFNITAGRGRNFFGEGHRSLMLSDNSYSYPYLRISTTVWRIRYVNLYTWMWDIRGAAGDPGRYARKNSAMHYLSFDLSDRINFGLFESVVWENADPDYPRGFDFNYWNPVIFLRPVEFGIGSPDNATLGFAFNVKFGRRGLFYSQLVLDEFLLREVRDGRGWYANKQGFQLGAILHDPVGTEGLDLRVEMNYVRPFMYTHSDTRQNHAHFGQPLAHPYGSNFVEGLASADLRRGRWTFREHFSYAVMGQDTGMYSWGNNMFRPENDRPPRDAEGRKDNYGYFIGVPVAAQVIFNEVRGGWWISPRGGLQVEASYLFQAWMPGEGDARTSHTFQIGLSARLRDRYADQQVRYVLP